MIDTILHDKLLENCRTQGAFLMERLGAVAKKYPCVKGVRGRGLMIGVVLDRPASELLPLLREKGLIALSAGETVLRLVPPLIVSRQECESALKIIESALKKISAPKKG